MKGPGAGRFGMHESLNRLIGNEAEPWPLKQTSTRAANTANSGRGRRPGVWLGRRMRGGPCRC